MINNQNYRNFVISFYKKKDNIMVDQEQQVNMLTQVMNLCKF